jgi:hypothetical protein
MNAETMLRCGGVIQLAILTASALVPGTLQWRTDLKKLPRLSRQLIWVHGGYIVLVIAAMGWISLCAATQLADGSLLARYVCGFVAVFWSLRLAIQLCVFDGTPYLANRLLKVGYHGLTVAFVCLSAIYGCVALGL